MLNRVQLSDQIKRLHERDARQAIKAYRASDVPTSYAAITLEWLTDVLCAGAPGAEVTDFRFSEQDNGSTNRRRIYLTYNEAGRAAKLPASVFSKASHSLESRFNMGLCGAAHGEKMFYTKIRPLLAIEAPKAFHADYDPESFSGIVLLEDIAEQVIFPDQNTPIDWERATSMVRLLARVHATMHEHPQLGSFDIRTWQQWWKRVCDFVYMEETAKQGFLAAEGVIPPRLFRRYEDFWPAAVRSVAAHDHLPRTLVHSDVHLRNWYLRPPGEMGLMDWQCVCTGNWSRDYAYAMTVALDVEDRRRWEKDLLRLYLDEVASQGGDSIPFDAAWTLYRAQMPTALAWWTNTLRPSELQPQDMQPQATALAFIGRVAHAIDDLDSFDAAVRA
jgi:Phosphotransferase enzyme family